MYILFIAVYLFLCVIIGKMARDKKLGFVRGFCLALFVSPFLAFFFAMNSGSSNPRGCKHCGNTENEAEYCGLCHKNEAGDLRPGM